MSEVTPWLDNYPIRRQLWASSARTPGSELKLVPTARNLNVRFRDPVTSAITLTVSELSSTPYVRVLDVERGLIEMTISGDAWNSLIRNKDYLCDVYAYGVLRETFTFTSGLPDSRTENLNGVELYTSPTQVLELLGLIPGAEVETAVDLSTMGWARNTEGYWTLAIPATQAVYGLWVGDLHAIALETYEEMALGPERCWTRVDTLDGNHSILYKGPENLASLARPITVETAFNPLVLRAIAQASSEVEAKTQRGFAKVRVFRETHDGLSAQRQLTPRRYPVTVDQFFRLDCFSYYGRDIARRYTESAVARQRDLQGSVLHVDEPTGLITLNDSIWDWGNPSEVGYEIAGGSILFGSFPKGSKNIEISYTGGSDRPPLNVAMATAKLAAITLLRFYARTMAQGMSDVNIGCGRMNFADGENYAQAWAKEADQLLENYQSLEFSLI
jgi:hypothetical protein